MSHFSIRRDALKRACELLSHLKPAGGEPSAVMLVDADTGDSASPLMISSTDGLIAYRRYLTKDEVRGDDLPTAVIPLHVFQLATLANGMTSEWVDFQAEPGMVTSGEDVFKLRVAELQPGTNLADDGGLNEER